MVNLRRPLARGGPSKPPPPPPPAKFLSPPPPWSRSPPRSPLSPRSLSLSLSPRSPRSPRGSIAPALGGYCQCLYLLGQWIPGLIEVSMPEDGARKRMLRILFRSCLELLGWSCFGSLKSRTPVALRYSLVRASRMSQLDEVTCGALMVESHRVPWSVPPSSPCT